MGHVESGRVPQYAQELLKSVREKTCYPLVWRQQPGLGHDSEVKVARPGERCHVLLYRPEYRDYELHFVVRIREERDQHVPRRPIPATRWQGLGVRMTW